MNDSCSMYRSVDCFQVEWIEQTKYFVNSEKLWQKIFLNIRLINYIGKSKQNNFKLCQNFPNNGFKIRDYGLEIPGKASSFTQKNSQN